MRIGGWLAYLLPIATGLGLLLRVVTYRRERRPGPPPEPAEPALAGPTEENATQ